MGTFPPSLLGRSITLGDHFPRYQNLTMICTQLESNANGDEFDSMGVEVILNGSI
jgi:hypothetical protein